MWIIIVFVGLLLIQIIFGSNSSTHKCPKCGSYDTYLEDWSDEGVNNYRCRKCGKYFM